MLLPSLDGLVTVLGDSLDCLDPIIVHLVYRKVQYSSIWRSRQETIVAQKQQIKVKMFVGRGRKGERNGAPFPSANRGRLRTRLEGAQKGLAFFTGNEYFQCLYIAKYYTL